MGGKKFLLQLSFWGLLATGIHIFSLFPEGIESYYSDSIYVPLACGLRFITGWLPFSLGDCLYGLLFLYFLIKISVFIRALFLRQISFGSVKEFSGHLVLFFLKIYVIFNILWGLNYNRTGIARQLGITINTYSADDLKMLNNILLQRVNESKLALIQSGNAAQENDSHIFSAAEDAYRELGKKYPFLSVPAPSSVKVSLWGWLGNYGGFMGYYNPFTGEAQVNTTIPLFMRYYTTCHEIAHQIGYARENEANFVGYLAAVSSKDTMFRYSAYLDLYIYSSRNLFTYDSIAAIQASRQLLPEVKEDLRTWRKFILAHKSPAEPVMRWVYDWYLQRNQQPGGILTYDEVNGYLVAYYKKYKQL